MDLSGTPEDDSDDSRDEDIDEDIEAIFDYLCLQSSRLKCFQYVYKSIQRPEATRNMQSLTDFNTDFFYELISNKLFKVSVLRESTLKRRKTN